MQQDFGTAPRWHWVVIAKVGSMRDGIVMTAEALQQMAAEFPEVLKYDEATGELSQRRPHPFGDHPIVANI